MKTLRKEAKAALTYVIEHGTTTSEGYRAFAGLGPSSVNQCLKRLMDAGLIKREREGRVYIYSVANLARALAAASCGQDIEIHKTTEQEERAELLRNLPSHPLPCSFVFSLGAMP